MAAWIPLIKTALPYVAQVLSVAIPAFTSKADIKKTSEIMPQQIAELQSAATQNAESVKILAEQLKGTIEGVDNAASKLQVELKSLRRRCYMAMSISAVSLLCALWAVLN
ncbi:MAG: hypothetical protein OQK98_16065 [Gammaproteobacteria bacterium]|nr:hypothetical protein [Gammaproteobacteria bacterium]